MRIGYDRLRSKVMSAEQAASFIISGRIEAAHAAGDIFQVRVWTGASTGPELDGALAKVDGIECRLPHNSDPIPRDKINRGDIAYFDMHLSQVATLAWQGFLGPLDTAVIEVSGRQGLADLRGLSPKQRAKGMIENCGLERRRRSVPLVGRQSRCWPG